MTALSFALDLFFPKSNSAFTSIHNYLTVSEIQVQTSFFKVLEPEQRSYLECIFVAANLKNPLIDDLIQRAKFGLEFAIAEDLASLVISKTKGKNFIPKPDIIVPVAADPKRFLSRGYHLPELISQYLARSLDKNYIKLVSKPKFTTQQTLLDRKSRLKNLHKAFEITKNQDLNIAKYTSVWLVDDITTTGTTLAETAKIIKKEFPFLKIYGLVVASNNI